jgi:hypothetical protein
LKESRYSFEWTPRYPSHRRGHGVEIRHEEEEGAILAFVEGYAWLRQERARVRIWLYKEHVKEQGILESDLKTRIEKLVVTRELKHGPLKGGLIAWFNA